MFKLLPLFVLPYHLIAGAATPADTPTKVPSARLIYQYKPMTWVENIAVRPNGQLLPITTTSSVLNYLDPKTGKLTFVHDFAAAGNAIQGIAEVHPDLFVINVLTCNITGDLTCTSGSLSSWTVDFYSGKFHGAKLTSRVRKVTAFPNAGFLNGVATLSAPRRIVLMADSFKGGIWSLDISTGKTKLLFTDPSMAGTAQAQNDINGIRVRHDRLYFINSAQGTFNRIPIDPMTGAKRGNATVIATGLAAPDDFEIDDKKGVAYLCNGLLDQVLKIDLSSGKSQILVGIPGPTSVRWSVGERQKNTLYASTIGGLMQYIERNVTIGGVVYSIQP